MTASEAEMGPEEIPLCGVRVLEVGSSIAGAFAGKWLAALGAEVIKLEPPLGDPARSAGPWPTADVDLEASARFLYLNTAKHSVVFEADSASDRRSFERLLGDAHILIDSRRSSDVAELHSRFPQLVVVSVTPFGRSGPYAELASSPLIEAALSGMLWHLGEPDRPPLVQPGAQPQLLTGLHALGAALSGLFAALDTGRGTLFDVTVQTCCAAAMGHYTARASQMGRELGRTPPRALWRVYPASDGWAGICALRRNYEQLAEIMGLPELAQSSPFLDHKNRLDEEQMTIQLLEGWFSKRSCAEVYALARRTGAPLAYVMPLRDVADSDQLEARDFFVRDEHPSAGTLLYPGQLWRSNEQRWTRARAPQLGESEPRFRAAPRALPPPKPAAERLPLAGVRVLDLGQIWAGPYAAMLLADQGADVIKVESPRAWDPNRCAAPPPEGYERDWWNTCAYFHEYSHNKRSLSLNLRDPRGKHLFAQLVARSDVVIENFRAETLERLGVDYAWMCDQRPDIVLVSMSGFGKSGPESPIAGYGPIIEQTSGLASLTGYGDGKPQLAQYAYGDPVAAVSAASAAISALIQRARTGRGQHIDLAQRDATAALIGEAFVEWSMTGRQPEVWGNRNPRAAPHGVYPAAGDHQWVAIAVETDAQWQRLRTAMGDPAWAAAPELEHAEGRCEQRDEIDRRVEQWTRRIDKLEVFERCRAQGVPAAPVWNDFELLADAQLRARGFHEPVSHPAVGSWHVHGWVWKPEGAGACVRQRAPDFGDANREVLGDWLGISADDLAQLEREEVIGTVPLGLPEIQRPK